MKFMTAVSKCGYIDKLDDIVDKYNDTYHRTMWNMPMLSQVAILNLMFKLTIRKVGDHERIQKCKNILQMDTLQIGLKKFY